jgi:hypothetical protein
MKQAAEVVQEIANEKGKETLRFRVENNELIIVFTDGSKEHFALTPYEEPAPALPQRPAEAAARKKRTS